MLFMSCAGDPGAVDWAFILAWWVFSGRVVGNYTGDAGEVEEQGVDFIAQYD
jgi:hypothetical protein